MVPSLDGEVFVFASILLGSPCKVEEAIAGIVLRWEEKDESTFGYIVLDGGG